MPYVMGCGTKQQRLSPVILCVLFRTLGPSVGGLWPSTHKPLTLNPSEHVHFYHLCILVGYLSVLLEETAPLTTINFILPIESNHD